MEPLERIDSLIELGKGVLASKRQIPSRTGILGGIPKCDSELFSSWRGQSLSFLDKIFPNSSHFYKDFENKIISPDTGLVEHGIGLLKGVKQEIQGGELNTALKARKPIDTITSICDRFHLAARQLHRRHDNRNTLIIEDEYDVQDLLHSFLRLEFDDIREEEYTPSYAGKASRVDFLLKSERVIIEVKKTRNGLKDKEVGTQLIEDIARYQSHPDCDVLVCFVYDPDNLISNPRGIEGDLNEDSEKLKVLTLIRP